MLLAMDIGNSSIKVALIDGQNLANYWRISTNRSYSSDEYGTILDGMFRHAGRDMAAVDGVMVSSVVPTINFTIDHMCQDYFHQTPLFVTPGIKTGINILYESPRDLGSDRICNAVAAFAIMASPASSSTLAPPPASGWWIGGGLPGRCICPGIKLASEALVMGTSKLPNFELVMPESVISKSTVSNLQAGVLYGYVGQVNYIVDRMKGELGDRNAVVVATGGLSRLIATQTTAIEHIDGLLTLKGLRIIHEKNRPA